MKKRISMPRRKHLRKVHATPRTDANQGVREHNERVRKQNEYIIKKIAEYKARQQAEAEKRRLAEQSTASSTIDGMQPSEDPLND